MTDAELIQLLRVQLINVLLWAEGLEDSCLARHSTLKAAFSADVKCARLACLEAEKRLKETRP